MDEIITALSVIANTEFKRATELHGGFNSGAEAYAVILEEFQEASEALAEVETELNYFWQLYRVNRLCGNVDCPAEIERAALSAAAELIQVVAMARKAQKLEEVEK